MFHELIGTTDIHQTSEPDLRYYGSKFTTSSRNSMGS